MPYIPTPVRTTKPILNLVSEGGVQDPVTKTQFRKYPMLIITRALATIGLVMNDQDTAQFQEILEKEDRIARDEYLSKREPMPLDDATLPVGKYKGLKILDIVRMPEGPEYLKWMLANYNGFKHPGAFLDTQEAIRYHLETI